MAEGSNRHVYWVSLQSGFGEKAVAFGFAFESALPSVGAVREQLINTGLALGQKLKLVPDGRGGRLITERTDMSFGVTGLVSLQDYLVPVWEPAE